MYDCNDANHAVNIKNLLEYSQSYGYTTASNESFYLDTLRHAEENEFVVINTNVTGGANVVKERQANYN